MIISCPNCNKKFNIDEKLIPKNGRLLQCSSCNHKWHYIITETRNDIKKNEKTQNKKEKKINNRTINNQEKLINVNLDSNLKKETNKTKISFGDILNNLIVIIITFIALILILDTFKTSISNYLPILMPLLDSLYQSLSDMRFFIKDLLT